MNNKESFSVVNRIKSVGYALSGLRSFFQTEHNAWLHILSAVCVIGIGSWFSITLHEWSMIAFAIGIVFIAEIFNTAIETLTDMVSPAYNEKAKKVKDLAAGGVLIAAFVAVAIGCLVFIPYLLACFS
jgi:diacylglycerol kinase (ATP)